MALRYICVACLYIMPRAARIERDFYSLIGEQNANGKYVCVGLDTDPDVLVSLIANGLPLGLRKRATMAEKIVAFNRHVIDATADIAAAYKPNAAFYRRLGHLGSWALKETIGYAHTRAPRAVVIEDAKIADIGSTNKHYAVEVFDGHKADAVTVHPYFGGEAMSPFLDRRHKGIIFLAKTSNPGAAELQNLVAQIPLGQGGGTEPIFEHVARLARYHWNANNNVGLVAGATHPEESERVRQIVGPEMFILSPGVGAQGQSAADIVPRVLRTGDIGVINSSRAIIFPKDVPPEKDFFQGVRGQALKLDFEIREAQGRV